VLQAADILLHKATHVPVGDDQRQHLEFARECATNFNHVFVSSYVPKKPAQELATMVAPEILLPPSAAGGRIMSLTNPSKKMSKSDPSYKSRILLSDPDNVIHKKIRAAVTDSLGPVTYEPDQRPGVANLLNILSALDAKGRDPETLAKEEGLWGEDMVTLKDAVSHAVCAELEPIRERYERWAKAPEKVREAIAESTERARRSAEKNMEAYRRVVGFGV
jgi:tryptophanyl-tRNA synthetase